MTFDDDYICLETPAGRKNVLCEKIGVEWPPHEKLEINGVKYIRRSHSSITDEQRADMTHVCRGALYEPELNS